MNEKQYQELVRRHPRLAKYYHYVRGGKDGRRGYYRRIPITYYDKRARPASLLEVQVALGKSAHGAFGKKGYRDGLPIVAAINRDNLRGKRYKMPAWKKALEDLGVALKEIAVVVEEKKEKVVA